MSTQVKPQTRSGPRPNRQATKVKTYVDDQLKKTREQVKTVDLLFGILALVAFVIAFVLIVIVIDAWIWPLSVTARWISLAVMIVSCIGYFGFAIVPLMFKKINPDYAARMIEESKPGFKNSILNYVALRKKPKELKPAIMDAVSRQAATDLSSVPTDATVDRSKLIQVGFLLCALTLIAVGYKVFSPKDPLQTVMRLFAPGGKYSKPAVVQIVDVDPGDTQVFFGETLKIAATIQGSHSPEDVRLIYSTLDGQLVDQTVSMMPSDAPNRYEIDLSMLDGGIQQSLNYQVVARDGASPQYEVSVRPNPSIAIESLTITPPKYTRLSERTLTGQGDIEAVEGSRVSLQAVANLPIQVAYIELLNQVGDLDSNNDRQFKAAATPIEMNSDGNTATGRFQVLLNSNRDRAIASHYRVKFVSDEGDRNENANIYPIRVIPDLAPEIRISNPVETNVEIPENGAMAIDVEANDLDFAISQLKLNIDHQGIKKLEQTLQLNSQDDNRRVKGRYILRPNQLGLKAGDKAVFFATAADNRVSPYSDQPDPNISETEKYTLEILEFDPEQEKKNEKGESEKGDQPPEENKDPEQGNDGKKDNSSDSGEEQDQGNEGESESENGEGEDGENSGEGEKGEGESGEGMDQQAEGENENGSSEGSKSDDGNQQGDNSSENKDNAQSQSDDSQGGNQEQRDPNQTDDSESKNENGEQGEENNAGSESQNQGESGESQDGSSDQMGEGQQPSSDGDQQGDQSGGGDQRSGNPQGESGNEQSDSEAGDGADGDGKQDGDLTRGKQERVAENASDGERMKKMQEHFEEEDRENGKSKQDGEENNDQGDPEKTEQESEQGSASGNKTGKDANNGNEKNANQNPESGNQETKGGEKGDPSNNGEQQSEDGGGNEKDSDAPMNNEDPKNGGEKESGQPSQQKNDGSKNEPSQQPSQQEPGEKKPGDKSQEGESPEGEKPSGQPQQNQPPQGDQKSNGEQGGSGDQPGGKGDQPPKQGEDGGGGGSESQQEGQQQASDSGGSEGSGSEGSQGGQPQEGAQKSDSPAQGNGQKSDSGSNPSEGGSANESQSNAPSGSGGASSGGTGKLEGKDKTNTAHAQKATDMVLKRLSEERHNPDPKLLEKMNWTKEELNQFLDRWEKLKQNASKDDQSRRRYNKALQSLGFRPEGGTKTIGQTTEKIEGLNQDAAVSKTPVEIESDFNAFMRNLNTDRKR